MNELQIFNYEGADVRVIEKDGEAWFVLKDVCDILELGNVGEVVRRLDDDELTSFKLMSGGQMREMYIVNEPGLYSVLNRSDKPKAKPFQRKVNHEILPTIRKHGLYATPATIENILTNPEFGIRILTALKEERAAKEKLQAQIEEDKPKVEFADMLQSSGVNILVRQFCKVLPNIGVYIGEKDFFQLLLKNHYIFRNKDGNYEPYQRFIDQGILTTRTGVRPSCDGRKWPTMTVLITPSGQEYFAKKLKKGEKNLNE